MQLLNWLLPLQQIFPSNYVYPCCTFMIFRSVEIDLDKSLLRFCQDTQTIFLQLEIGFFKTDGWIVFVSLYLMHHSTLAFLALINMDIGIGNFSLDTLLFLVFHMLHKSATLSTWIRELMERSLINQVQTLLKELDDLCMPIQLWPYAYFHTICETR